LYTKFIASPFKEKFPEEKLFCEPSALFSDGDAPTAAAKVLVIGHFATRRFFQETGERLDRQLGQVPQRLGRPAVHLYEHQGRIEMQQPRL
jgi:hypothetical protein